MAIVTVGIDLAKNVFAATLAEVRSSEGLGGTLRWRNVKVQHIFAHSQFCVESDYRLVSAKSFAGEVTMRASDHQLQQPLFVSRSQKVDKTYPYSVENTGYTFAPVKQLDPYVSSMPTSCQIKRPSAG